MQRWKVKIAYDGTEFSGWQVQPEKRTVQREINQALARIHQGQQVNVTASGRTDAGVHAKGQIIHFDSPLQIPADRWSKALGAHLPDDIQIIESVPVSAGFHARFDAAAKEYRYFVRCGQERDVFSRHYAHHVYKQLDERAMQSALDHLVGTFDFSSFCASNTNVVDKVRTLFEARVERNADDQLVFVFRGNGFLYNMVRIITGTVLAVGTGEKDAGEMVTIRNARDRRFAGKTAPGHGLYLWDVYYKDV
ncbi:tRNA pseudouridine(38-40) synthase TruA [Geomicrobium sp. JCM 19055]|uniref:tRNA pseudouridine(38-40) synthase TruA n=1 Tax=Geomicrobium sp. JCM 19055 TaxID=1460649 RepID=UPI00045EDA85|nr:tRNA pseudouridine(38-40) synthase TruA [Geomicrobium sp. JCM 19055]GAK01094.1 tRNA pseudouridine synthase A [Geomicrobium sp. JCM 19055]